MPSTGKTIFTSEVKLWGATFAGHPQVEATQRPHPAIQTWKFLRTDTFKPTLGESHQDDTVRRNSANGDAAKTTFAA
jgi:hypothetical protein